MSAAARNAAEASRILPDGVRGTMCWLDEEGMRFMITTVYHSPLGDITLAADARGLTGLWFAGQAHFASTLGGDELSFDMEGGAFHASGPGKGAGEKLPGVSMDACEAIEGCDAVSGSRPMTAENPENAAAVGVLERAWAWLNAYFAGQAPCWIPPLHFEGTEFQHAVWVSLLEIPYGETISYGELARRVSRHEGRGDGRARDRDPASSARAVGRAVGSNPISIIVPCHRVVACDGSLAGYAGGIERKHALLELEGAL